MGKCFIVSLLLLGAKQIKSFFTFKFPKACLRKKHNDYKTSSQNHNGCNFFNRLQTNTNFYKALQTHLAYIFTAWYIHNFKKLLINFSSTIAKVLHRPVACNDWKQNWIIKVRAQLSPIFDYYKSQRKNDHKKSLADRDCNKVEPLIKRLNETTKKCRRKEDQCKCFCLVERPYENWYSQLKTKASIQTSSLRAEML